MFTSRGQRGTLQEQRCAHNAKVEWVIMTPFTPSPVPCPSASTALVPGHVLNDGSEMTGCVVWVDRGFSSHPLRRATWTSPSPQAAQMMEARRPSLAPRSPPCCDSSSPLQVNARVPSEKSHSQPPPPFRSFLCLPHPALTTLTHVGTMLP